MKKFTMLLSIIAAFTLYPSCKKNDIVNKPVSVDTTKIFGIDSTKLVKSISVNHIDSFGIVNDSSRAYLYYDTVNRKIILSAQYVPSANNPNYGFELSYNNSGYIIQLKNNPVYFQDTADYSTVDYTYDAQNVLNSVTSTTMGGLKEINQMTKSGLPSGGYSLSTKGSSTNFVYDSISETFDFDATGRLTSWTTFDLPTMQVDLLDSIQYDAGGNITKVIETNPAYIPATYTLFSFSGRDTKGNQFYDLNKLLYRGIDQFPTNDGTIAVGGELNDFGNLFFYQSTVHPALSVTVSQQFTNSLVTFNPDAQYDSQNRLVKFKMYDGEEPDYYYEYGLSYYK